MENSRSAGLLLIGCTVLSVILANLPATRQAYISFWHTNLLSFSATSPVIPDAPVHVINDFLMAFFFLLVAMEIKREMMEGQLASIRKSLLPVFAALGGMIVPAVIFSLFNSHSVFSHGWGIPMATDIAFSLGVLSLLGRRVPFELKIFLMALAIMDDMGGIATIALFYGGEIHYYSLIIAAALLTIIVAMNKAGVQKMIYYALPGLLLWYFIYRSGIHGTIAGALFAFSIPRNKNLEVALSRPVNFILMPVFALANMAISFTTPLSASASASASLSLGIIAGLVLGKPLGIFAFSFLAHKSGIARLPARMNYKQLLGIGLLGGIGFTMSIFTATLAFDDAGFQVTAKVAIMLGSLVSACLGFFYLKTILSESARKDRHRSVPAERVHALPEMA